MDVFLFAVVVLLILGAYFLPTIIAIARGHRQAVAIFLLNLFLGWTMLGWVGALVWSAVNDCEPRRCS
jgi:hypothetical protein